jgi:hypothetical protein
MTIVQRGSAAYWRHLWIRLQLRRWIVPVLCAVPYLLCLAWMLMRGMVWLAQIMLAPLVMAALLWLLTWWLARLEFRQQRRTR